MEVKDNLSGVHNESYGFHSSNISLLYIFQIFLGIVRRMISFWHPLVPLVLRVFFQSLCFCQPSAGCSFSSCFHNSPQTFLPCISHTENSHVRDLREAVLAFDGRGILLPFTDALSCPPLVPPYAETSPSLPLSPLRFTLDSKCNPFSSRPRIYYPIFLVFSKYKFI